MKGSLGNRVNMYPARVGTGKFTNDDKAKIIDRILALALLSVTSISFAKKALETEYAVA